MNCKKLGSTLLVLALLALIYLAVIGVQVLASPSDIQLLLVAVVCGGLLGGLTVAMLGESAPYSVKLPAIQLSANNKPFQVVVETGFLGDMFVGLMASLLIVGALAGVSTFSFFKVTPTGTFVSEWVKHFATAYLAGFLGLRLIRVLADNLMERVDTLKKAVDEQKLEADKIKQETRMNQAQALFNSGKMALEKEEYDEATRLFSQQRELDGDVTIRATVALALAQRGKKEYGHAIRLLNAAIEQSAVEKVPVRVATAYLNRACYRSLCSEAPNVDEIISDVEKAIEIDKTFAIEFMKELEAPNDPKSKRGDLAKLKDDPKIVDFINKLKGKGLL